MSQDIARIDRRQKFIRGVINIGLTALLIFSILYQVKHSPNLFSILLTCFFYYAFRRTYLEFGIWLGMPIPRYKSSTKTKRIIFFVAMIFLILLSLLIEITAEANIKPENRNYFFTYGVMPYFIVTGYVLLAILLGVTDCLPKRWENYFKRSVDSPTKFDATDRRALIISIIGLLIGNSVNIIRTSSILGMESIGFAVLGAILVDIYAIGAFFWIFRSGNKWWGIIILVLWTLFNTFSLGIALANDLGIFIKWMISRVFGLLSF